jgi:hypothetical protein
MCARGALQVGACFRRRDRAARSVDHSVAIDLLKEGHRIKLLEILESYEVEIAAIDRRRIKLEGELAQLGTITRRQQTTRTPASQKYAWAFATRVRFARS